MRAQVDEDSLQKIVSALIVCNGAQLLMLTRVAKYSKNSDLE